MVAKAAAITKVVPGIINCYFLKPYIAANSLRVDNSKSILPFIISLDV